APLRASLDGSRRNDNHALSSIQPQFDIHKLVGKQCVVAVIENCLQLRGSRSGIDLVIDREQSSAGQLLRSVPVIGINRQVWVGAEPLQDLRQIILGNAEEYGDRLQLSDRGDSSCIGGMDDISLIHLAKADSTAKRRRDPAINQLKLGLI